MLTPPLSDDESLSLPAAAGFIKDYSQSVADWLEVGYENGDDLPDDIYWLVVAVEYLRNHASINGPYPAGAALVAGKLMALIQGTAAPVLTSPDNLSVIGANPTFIIENEKNLCVECMIAFEVMPDDLTGFDASKIVASSGLMRDDSEFIFTANGLASNGDDIHLRVAYKNSSGAAGVNHYQFSAGEAQNALVSPLGVIDTLTPTFVFTTVEGTLAGFWIGDEPWIDGAGGNSNNANTGVIVEQSPANTYTDQTIVGVVANGVNQTRYLRAAFKDENDNYTFKYYTLIFNVASTASTVSATHKGPAFISTLGPSSDSQSAVLPKDGSFVQVHDNVRIRRASQKGDFAETWQNAAPYHTYSNRAAYSADGSIIEIAQSAVSASGLNVIRSMPFSKMLFTKSQNKLYGFPYQSAQLRIADVDGTNVSDVRNFSGDGFSGTCTFGSNEGDMSRDDRFIPVSDGSKMCVYDAVNDTVSSVIDVPDSYNMCSVTPTGRYFLVMQTLYSNDPNYRRYWRYTIDQTTGQISNPELLHEWSEHDCLVYDDANDEDWIFMVGNPSRWVRVRDGTVIWLPSGDDGHSAAVYNVPNIAMASYNLGIVFVKREVDTSIAKQTVTISGLSDSRNMHAASSLSRAEYQSTADVWQNVVKHRAWNGFARGSARFDGNRGVFRSAWDGQLSPAVDFEFELF